MTFDIIIKTVSLLSCAIIFPISLNYCYRFVKYVIIKGPQCHGRK